MFTEYRSSLSLRTKNKIRGLLVLSIVILGVLIAYNIIDKIG